MMIMISFTDDFSRVVLAVPDSQGNDYVNASFVDVSLLQLTHMHITGHTSTSMFLSLMHRDTRKTTITLQLKVCIYKSRLQNEEQF